jgi:hypothetical protein
MSDAAPWLVAWVAAFLVVTVAAASSLDAATNRAKPRLSVLLAGLLLPAAGLTLLSLSRGQDRHGFGLVAMLVFVAISLPICMATSAATVWLTRRLRKRR